MVSPPRHGAPLRKLHLPCRIIDDIVLSDRSRHVLAGPDIPRAYSERVASLDNRRSGVFDGSRRGSSPRRDGPGRPLSTSSRLLILVISILTLCVGTRAQNPATGAARTSAGGVTTTEHPPLPGQPWLYWLVPESSMSRAKVLQAIDPDAAGGRFARGAALVDAGDFAGGLALIQGAGAGISRHSVRMRSITLAGHCWASSGSRKRTRHFARLTTRWRDTWRKRFRCDAPSWR